MMVAPDPRMEPFLRQAGFWYVAQLVPAFDYDRALISALVERWRPESHTFHFPYGECTVTLEDVVFQLGLRVDGLSVSGCIGAWEKFYNQDIWALCADLLGIVPDEKYRKGFSINLNWFTNTFQTLPHNADEQMIIRYTRAYIMVLFGGVLFPDKSGFRVHMKWLPLLTDFNGTANFSWGSAVLGSLYRELCRAVKYNVTEIAGCLPLLQSWAWYRVPQLAPRQHHPLTFPLALRWRRFRYSTTADTNKLLRYRQIIDSIGITGFRWTPYRCDEVRDVTPPFVYEEADVWASVTALIHFAVIEWHAADRVVRQFGGAQHIPTLPINIDRLHAKDGRGDLHIWWPEYHVTWHQAWEARRERRVQYPLSDDDRPSVEYFEWYLSVANRFLSLDGAPQDPELRDLPDGVPDQAPPPPDIPHPADVPDHRSFTRRVRSGTRASGRQYPDEALGDDGDGLDDDDDDDDDHHHHHHADVQPEPEPEPEQEQEPQPQTRPRPRTRSRTQSQSQPRPEGSHQRQPEPSHQPQVDSSHHPGSQSFRLYQPTPTYPSQQFMAGPSQQFMSDPSQQFMAGPSQQFMAGPSQQFMSGPSHQFMAGPSQQQFMAGLSQQHYMTDPSQHQYMTSASQPQFMAGPSQQFMTPSQQFMAGPSHQFISDSFIHPSPAHQFVTGLAQGDIARHISFSPQFPSASDVMAFLQSSGTGRSVSVLQPGGDYYRPSVEHIPAPSHQGSRQEHQAQVGGQEEDQEDEQDEEAEQEEDGDESSDKEEYVVERLPRRPVRQIVYRRCVTGSHIAGPRRNRRGG